MAKEGGYIQIKAGDIGPASGNKWGNIQEFFDQAQTRFEYGTVLGLTPGNYYIKAMLLSDYLPGVAVGSITAKVTSNVPMLTTGLLTLKDDADNLVHIAYSSVSQVAEEAVFTVNITPSVLIKAGTIAWTDSPEMVDVQAGALTGQLLAVQEGAAGVRVKGGPQLGEAGGCRIINTALVVYSIKQIDDVFQSYQEAIDALESGSLGLPIPSDSNTIWLFIENNMHNETLTIKNPYLSVELVSGLRGLIVIKDYII